tara:strand:- start:228 stop:446 length:219 start_codon:yes stop_codon:yes gene_type:complete
MVTPRGKLIPGSWLVVRDTIPELSLADGAGHVTTSALALVGIIMFAGNPDISGSSTSEYKYTEKHGSMEANL